MTEAERASPLASPMLNTLPARLHAGMLLEGAGPGGPHERTLLVVLGDHAQVERTSRADGKEEAHKVPTMPSR